jgi:16S rRNA (adenine1518-N6/adenine1519-N6)-dimethyltransferase
MSKPELIGARRLRALFEDHGFVPRQRWGQNFVIDPNTIRKTVDVSGVGSGDHVLEIGAGAGSLTLELAARARRVTAIEVDMRLAPILDETVGALPNVDVVFDDALAADLTGVETNRMVGNLPYNIAATVVLRVLESAPRITDLTVMTQREVGERLGADAGTRAYGLTSVLVAYWGRAWVAARVARTAFFPVPNVDSVLVRIERRPPPDVDRERLLTVLRAAFSQRRKTLRNALATTAGSVHASEAALRAAGLDPAARAETIDLAGFVALARNLS